MNHEPILILADPKGKAWNFAKEVFKILNSNESRDRVYHLAEVEIKKFNNGEVYAKIHENVRQKTCYFIHDSSMYPQDWLVSLALVNDALMRSSANKITNVLPCLKFARQDRIAEARTPISSSVVAKIIMQHAYRVITCDLHNPATTGSYDIPFDNLKAFPVIIEHLKKNHAEFLENAILVSPDIGSAKRAESYAKRLGLGVAIIDKKRKEAGIIDSMTIIGDVAGKNIIMVDDLIDSGGTLCKAADTLKQAGANKIYACATHGEFSGNAIEKITCSNIDKVIITDSVPKENKFISDKIEIISLAPLFADVIFRISQGLSISELFEK